MTGVGVRVERLYCPLCEWTHERESPSQTTHAVPPDGYPPLHEDPATFQDAVANVAYATVLHDALQIECVIREHLETHSLLEWFAEVMRLRGERDRYRAVIDEALGWLPHTFTTACDASGNANAARDVLRRAVGDD